MFREQLQAWEKEIGYKLPAAYAEFLLENNGGKPQRDFFQVPGWKHQQSLITEFESMVPDGGGFGLKQIYDIKADIFPAGFIPIGSDPGGNLILMSLSGDTLGSIYFWDHEEAPDDRLERLADYTNIYFMAASFEDFVNNLKHENEL